MAERDSDLLGLSPEEGAQRVALVLLEAAAQAAKDLRKGSSDEALHHFRTALRRTRSWLQSWARVIGKTASKFERKLERIADQTNAGRDAEVQLEHLGTEEPSLQGEEKRAGEALARRLRAECRQGYAAARAVLPEFTRVRRELESALRHYRAELLPAGAARRTWAQAAAEVLRTLAEDLSLWLSLVEGQDDLRALHKARIRAKRLRYALEPLREFQPDAVALVERTQVLQDALGALHDLHLWRERLVAKDAHSSAEAEGLGRLLARADAQLTQSYEAFAREWLEGGAAALLAELDAFCDQLPSLPGSSSTSGPPLEIERKYLLKALPARARRGEAKEILQGWIPGQVLQERLRRVEQNGQEHFFRTVKLGRGVKRIEVEEEAPGALFEKLWPLTEGRRVHKRRWVVREGNAVWELDEFLDRELTLAEIELEREDQKVAIPKWLAPVLVREVTGEDAYVNINLAR